MNDVREKSGDVALFGDPFGAGFRESFAELVRLRRDVRRFRADAVPDAILEEALRLAHLAPSVGFSQPWRFVLVEDKGKRAAARASFKRANAAALERTAPEDRALYARLKLEGMREAPVQMAVFCDEETNTGRKLGARSMPEMRAYSTVCAIHTLWLALRAHGVGLGWVSILEPEEMRRICGVPAGWRFVAWLCIGWPEEARLETPELERLGWERRLPLHALCRRI